MTVAGMRPHADVGLMVAGYFALALAADATALETSHVIAFWPASGLLVTALLLSDRRRWPALIAAGAAGAAAFNLLDDDPGTVAVFVTADMTVALAGAVAVRRWAGELPDTGRIRDVLVLCAGAGLLGPALGALVAGAGLSLALDAPFGRVFVTFLLSNVVGVLMVAPLAIAASAFGRRPGRPRRALLELAGMTAVATLIALGFFVTELPVGWMTLIVPVIAALRWGVLGSAVTFAPVTVLAVLATTHGYGMFAGAVASEADGLAFAQAFIAIAGTLANLLGAASGQLEIALVGLRRSEDRFRMLVDGVRDHAIFTLDVAGHIDSWNASARRMFGYRQDEVAGERLEELAAGAGVAELRRGVERARVAGRFEGEAAVRNADGVTFLGHFTISPLNGGVGFAVIVRDVTESRRGERQLRHMALHDALTGLPNRTLLTDRLDVALRGTEREGGWVAVLFCDLDRFKLVNDSLGHAAGDSVLAEVAHRLRDVVRPEDTVARFGGDEFVVCCRQVVDAQHAIRLAERVRARLSEPIVVDGEQLYVFGSVGIALGAAGADSAELLRDADVAMYRAKQSGAGYELATEEDHARALGRLRDETAVRRALEQGEMTLHYQPIVDLHERRVVSLEALLRWRHPVDGLLAPADFIRVAEETGAIVPIGGWAVREALAAGRRLRSVRPDHASLVINVNVSARQLGAGDLVATVAQALADTGTDPHLLCLELTETELIEDVRAYATVLGRLERLGVRLAIDDFGAGYSSLRYLSSLPIQAVKVDRAFVAGLARADGGAPILRAAVSMARAFELDAVAEGVERPDQEEALVQMGYRLAQGYHYARPLPEPDAAALLGRYGPEKPILGSFDASLT